MKENKLKFIFVVLSSCLFLSLVGCSKSIVHEETHTFHQKAMLDSFAKNGVQVTLTLEENQHQQSIIAATFKPEQSGFHLYGKELPILGIEGVGRPTRLEISTTNDIEIVGSLLESTPSQLYEMPGFDEPFPMYPVGSMTLRQILKLPSDITHLRVNLTYMACSEQGLCLAPVVGHEIDLELNLR